MAQRMANLGRDDSVSATTGRTGDKSGVRWMNQYDTW